MTAGTVTPRPPLKTADTSVLIQTLARTKSAGDKHANAGRRTEIRSIMLVDDDEAVLDTFGRMLRLKGYDVCTVANPVEGLKVAAQRRPDAIILDFRMPLLDGLGFLRSLRALDHHRDTPVAIVTGDYFLDDIVTDELQALGGMVLFKPLWLEQLVDLARTLVTREA